MPMEDLQRKYHESIDKLFQTKKFKNLKDLLSDMEPADIAEIISEKSPVERVFIFRLLPKDLAIEVFEFMEGAEREEMLAHFTDSEVSVIIEEMSDDDRTALFDELPAKTVKKLLLRLSPEERTVANALLNYPDGSAGRIMTPEYIDLKEGMTTEEAIDRIRKNARSKETIYTCFVVNGQRQLKGVVDLESLIMAKPQTLLSSLMDEPIYVITTTDQEEVAQVMSKYDLQAVPVVDTEKRLVGIITFDDVLDIVEEEATEDFERMAGIQPVEEDYLDASVFTVARKRFVWLFICILTETLTTTVLQRYTLAIQSVVTLTFFVPLLIDTGGNAGTQASTLVIRGITLGHIEWKDIWRVVLREVVTGILLGGTLAIFGIGRAYMLNAGSGVAITVAISIIAVVLLGNLAGTLLPFIARLVKVDPAIMSGPFITTIVDVFGLIVYFEIARRILSLPL
jgi:magnesium transporter